MDSNQLVMHIQGQEYFATLSGSGNPVLFWSLWVDLDEHEC
jgi:hypothetical protein